MSNFYFTLPNRNDSRNCLLLYNNYPQKRMHIHKSTQNRPESTKVKKTTARRRKHQYIKSPDSLPVGIKQLQEKTERYEPAIFIPLCCLYSYDMFRPSRAARYFFRHAFLIITAASFRKITPPATRRMTITATDRTDALFRAFLLCAASDA